MPGAVPVTIDTLRPSHIADLRRLSANPRAIVQVQRRKLFMRLGLIVPGEPPRPPSEGRGRPKVRAHVLTDLGRRVLDDYDKPPARTMPRWAGGMM